MKLTLSTIQYTLLLAITLIVASCAKDGPTGPTGPAGSAGPQGPAGTAGTPGTPGTTGTANVIYSDWLDVTYQPNADSSVWSAEIAAPQLVDSILNQGDIKVYWNIGSDSTNSQFIVPLPVFDAILFNNIVTVNAYFENQLITLLSNFDTGSFTDNGNNYFQYRYILIPGGIKVLRPVEGQPITTINWDNYDEVKKFLGLKD